MLEQLAQMYPALFQRFGLTPGAQQPGAGPQPMPMPMPNPIYTGPGVMPGNPGADGGTSFIDQILGGGGMGGGSPWGHPIAMPGSPPTTGGGLPPYNGGGEPGMMPGNPGGGAIAMPGGSPQPMPMPNPITGQPGATGTRPAPMPGGGGSPITTGGRAPDPGFSLKPGQMPGMRQQPQQPRIGNSGTSGWGNSLPRRMPGGF